MEELLHSIWVHGLKSLYERKSNMINEVALYMGAWIEISAFASKISSMKRCTLYGCVD